MDSFVYLTLVAQLKPIVPGYCFATRSARVASILDRTKSRNASSDLIIVTGGITNFGHREDVKIVLDETLRHNSNILCMAGNLDNSDVNDYLENLGMNLHGQAHIIRCQVCVY